MRRLDSGKDTVTECLHHLLRTIPLDSFRHDCDSRICRGVFRRPARPGKGRTAEYALLDLSDELPDTAPALRILGIQPAHHQINGRILAQYLLAHPVMLVGNHRLECHVHPVWKCIYGTDAVEHFPTILPVDDVPCPHHLFREHPDSPCPVLELMTGKFRHQASGIFPVQTPVDMSLKIGRWHGAPPVIVPEPVIADINYRAELPCAYGVHYLDVFRVEKPLLPDKENPARCLALAVHVETLLHRICHCLLAEDMFPCRKGICCHPVMQIERRSYDNCIHFLVFQEFPVVIISSRRWDLCGCLVKIGLVIVAKGHNLRLRNLQKIVYVETASRPGTYYTEPHFPA